MARKVSVRDVAKEAGVSIGSVSRVLNGGSYVSKDLRSKVINAVEKLGYQPDANARNLRMGSSKTIGCLIPDLANPLYAAHVSAIEDRLQEDGYMLLLGSSKGNPVREKEIMKLFISRGMDGIIAAPLREETDEQDDIFSRCSLPLVIVDRDMDVSGDRISVDHRGGVQKVVEYLFSLGHRRIVLLTPGSNIRPGRERIAGYNDAHIKAGIAVDPDLIRAINPRLITSYEDIRVLLASSVPPTAIIGLGTQILSAAMRAVYEAGLSIPDDISVVGIGTPDTAEFAYPPMTMLRFDLDDYGRSAADLILDRIHGGRQRPQHNIVKPMELVIAESCGRVR